MTEQAEELRRRVRASGIPYREIARRAGLGSDGTVRKFMKGKRSSIETADRIAAALATESAADGSGDGNRPRRAA